VGVVALDGKIHAVAGRTLDRVTSALHEVYDPATDSWSDAAPLPTARDHFAIAVVDGRIHVIGGR
ncbi:MAG: galactose oxidase, partial [Gemmatimonadales bacterium]|nr:galactose oxidase [Gemmatimonadales bacterium]